MDFDTVTQLDVGLLTLVGAFLIPLLTGLITKYFASSGLKAISTLTLSAAAGLVQTAIDAGGSVVLKEWIGSAVVAWVLSLATYYGLWKPTGTAERVQRATANVGIGSSDPTYEHYAGAEFPKS